MSKPLREFIALKDGDLAAHDERIFFRLVSIGVRRFSAEPETRDSAITLILANALRLAVRLLGRRQAAKLALWILEGDD